MKFGHHGANHPVQDLETRRVAIIAEPRLRRRRASAAGQLQGHPRVAVRRFVQGFRRTDRPAFCFQGHPEASPRPHDIGYLFRPLRRPDARRRDDLRRAGRRLDEAAAALDRLRADDATLAHIAQAGELARRGVRRPAAGLFLRQRRPMCDAMHFAEELSGGFREDRPAMQRWR